MKIKLLTAGAATAAIAIAGAGCGSNDNKDAAAGNGVDRAFVAGMVPHHKSAVEMATIAQKRGQSQFVKTLADNIIRTQNQEISVMRTEDSQLADAGTAKGDLGVAHGMMGMSMDNGKLRTATPFDRAFISMMVPHHQGALVMAKAELAKGKDPELRTLAQNIIAGQTREIAQMKAHQTGGTTAG